MNTDHSSLHTHHLPLLAVRALIALFLIFLSPYAFAAEIKLAWDPPTEYSDGTLLTDLAGYRVYYGTALGVYGQSVDVPLGAVVINNGVAMYPLTGLTEGQTYFIAVTACITFTPSDESDYSNEVIGGIFVVATSPAVGGSVSKSPDKATYVYGDQIQLTAAANPGYTFSGWSGDASGTTNPVTVTMDGSKAVTASFTQDQYSLAVSPSPAVGGSVSKSPDKVNYVYGEQVQLTAAANPGYTFSGWSGDASGATITMDANKTVIGNFTAVPGTEPPPGPVNGLYTVVTSPSGLQITVDGTNYTAPQIFNWSSGSTHTISTSSFQSGASGTRYVFSSWSDGGAQDHTITAPSVSTPYTANFRTQYSLTTAVSPSGGGTISIPGTNWYNGGQSVSISAKAGSGYAFSAWAGDLSDTTNPVSFAMNGPKNITGNFVTTFSYTVATSPTSLQITVDGTNYTAPQIFNWSSGSTHTVSVSSPQNGASGTRYVFSSWSDGGSQEHTITAPSGSTTYTANFTTQYSLTTAVNPTGGGTAIPSGTSWYDSGPSVSVSVIAGSEYSFSGWSEDLTGSTNPTSLAMNGPKSVTAEMTPIPETIFTPAQPSGPSSGSAGISYSYFASGASSNLGHPLEYQFNWGNGTLSTWSSSATAFKTWSSGGSYAVKVQARCGVHTNVVSAWSTGTPVIIQAAFQITCTDDGIQCLERTDGSNDGDNLVNGRPKVNVEYQFKIVMQDKRGTPEYVKLFMTQRSDPREPDFYGYDMSCSGDYATGANCTYRTKFGPAPVHKIFFQAKTSGGTIITYPDSGYITGPQIHLLRGYNLVGIPRDINNALFDGQEALGSPEVYRWQADEGYYTEVTTSEPVLAGEGYLVYTHNATLIELADFGEVQAQEYAYPLKPGLNCISNPYSGNVRLSNVKIQKGTQTPVSWQEAASNGWVVDALYYYNGEDWGDTYSHMTAEGGAVLVPWLGYWMDLNSTDDAYFLVIPKP